MTLDHAELAVVVHEGRPVFEAEAVRPTWRSLRSFYQNRGYLEFTIESTQVSISPDKEEVFITVNISEGRCYTVSGDQRRRASWSVAEPEIAQADPRSSPAKRSRGRGLQASVKDDQRAPGHGRLRVRQRQRGARDRSRRRHTVGVHVLRRRRPPRLRAQDQHQRQLAKTRDEVIRREMRQLEDAWYDGTRIERSKVRVRRLGYFEEGSVNVETPPVPGTTDQVDIELDAWPRRTPATCSPAWATRAPKAWCSTRRSRSRTSSAPATRWRWRSTPARSTARSR